jgi:hypothetical protein
MGVFSSNSIYNEAYDNVDLLSSDIPYNESYDIDSGAVARIIAETETNWTNLMTMVGICELHSIETEGDVIYEAADGKGFFAKLKSFFINLLEKIKKLFKNFAVKLNSMFMDSKSFVKKYVQQIRSQYSKLSDSFSVEGYKFTPATLTGIEFKTDGVIKTVVPYASATIAFTKDMDVDAIMDKVKSEVKKGTIGDVKNSVKRIHEDLSRIREDKSEIMDHFRGEVIALAGGPKASVSSDRFSEELDKVFGLNQTYQLRKSDLDINLLMSYCTDYEKVTKATNKAYKSYDTEINKFIKNLDNASTKLSGQYSKTLPEEEEEKNSDVISICVSYVQLYSDLVKDGVNITETFHNAQMAAMKKICIQSKHILTKILTASSKNESVDYGYYGVRHSLLDGIEFK